MEKIDGRTIKQSLDDLMSYYKSRNTQLTERTIKNKEFHFKYLSKFFPNPIKDITTQQIEEYAKEKLKKVNRNTVKMDLLALEDCFIVLNLIKNYNESPVYPVLNSLRERSNLLRRGFPHNRKVSSGHVSPRTGSFFPPPGELIPEESKTGKINSVISEPEPKNPIDDYFTVTREWAALLGATGFSFSCQGNTLTIILSGIKCEGIE